MENTEHQPIPTQPFLPCPSLILWIHIPTGKQELYYTNITILHIRPSGLKDVNWSWKVNVFFNVIVCGQCYWILKMDLFYSGFWRYLLLQEPLTKLNTFTVILDVVCISFQFVLLVSDEGRGYQNFCAEGRIIKTPLEIQTQSGQYWACQQLNVSMQLSIFPTVL